MFTAKFSREDTRNGQTHRSHAVYTAKFSRAQPRAPTALYTATPSTTYCSGRTSTVPSEADGEDHMSVPYKGHVFTVVEVVPKFGG